MTSVSKRRAGSTERRFRGALRLVATLGIEHPLDALDGLLRENTALQLDELPMNKNGKIDRTALAALTKKGARK